MNILRDEEWLTLIYCKHIEMLINVLTSIVIDTQCNGHGAQTVVSTLADMCMKEVNALAHAGVILLSETDIKPTLPGRLMARHCVSFSTMKTFLQVGV